LHFALQAGSAYALHMPGELPVEYQLAAQRPKPAGRRDCRLMKKPSPILAGAGTIG
jgi:hypothetical protein